MQWKKNVQDLQGEVLCGEKHARHHTPSGCLSANADPVSQFTLLAQIKKGNKPDFHRAAPVDQAKELYDYFYAKVGELYEAERVKNGVFQAMMDVGLVNDGPVCISLVVCSIKNILTDSGQVTVEVDVSPPMDKKNDADNSSSSR